VTWEAVSALASLASAFVVAIAAIAAVLQIRHLRAGNQLEAILGIHATFNEARMVEARAYVLYEFPAHFAADPPDDARPLDPRVLLVANFHNEIGALVADGFLVERLVWPLVPVTSNLWKALEPAARALRATRADPIWADFEYIASLRERITSEMYLSRYPEWFRRRLRDELAGLPPRPDA
jgi:hypothetical protein